MKRTKFFVGLAVLLVAAAGAFASVQKQAVLRYYIDNSGQCVDHLTEKICFENPVPDCLDEVAPTVFKQLYSQKVEISTGVFECRVPLNEQPPQ